MRSAIQTLGACFVLAATAAACSCIPAGTVAHEFSQSDVVFLGRVVSVERIRPLNLPQRKKVTFHVEEAFKGVRGGEIVVETGISDADCGLVFSKGGRYLVYAYRQPSPDALAPWGTGLCTRTRPAWRARKDIKELRGLKWSRPTMSAAGSGPHCYSK